MTNINLKDIQSGMARSSYRGVPIHKYPMDYVIYQMIINEVKPDLIIEIGTLHGGSALYFADLMDILKIENGEVHTIDIVDFKTRKNEHLDINCEVVEAHPRIKTFKTGFDNYSLNNCKGFNNILVIDDGSHIYEDVLNALKKFKNVVSPGSYFIVEDGNALDMDLEKEHIKAFNGGPLSSISSFLRMDNTFTIDLKWCDLYGINSTFNTYGYLKKIK